MVNLKNKNKKFSISEVESLLKKQKIIFAMWNASSKYDTPHQNYYLPLKKLFGKTILFDPRKIRFAHGSEQMNKKFILLVKKELPDYIFLIVGRDELTIETMEKIKEISPNTKIIAFVGDDDREFEPLKRYQALFVDCNFIAQPNYIKRYHKEGLRNVYPTVGINADIFKPIDLIKEYCVSFIGQPSKPRLEVVRFLIKNNVNIRIFGRGWENYPDLKKFYSGFLESGEMIKVINKSKINLAFSKNRYGVPHFKGRVFEFALCKSFSLVDYFQGYSKFFKENKEIVMFKNKKDLLKKINYYLNHEKEREKIAGNSYKKALENHDVLKEFKFLFKTLLENKEIFLPRLPKINKKIFLVTKNNIDKNLIDFEKLLIGYDYVSFSDGSSSSLRYKDSLQIYSLDKTKKKISCCDYYVSDKNLGNHLLLDVYKSFKNLKRNKFNQLLSINQIMVSKKYFLKNLDKFKDFLNGKEINIINEKNTCFISIPLIQIKKINKIDYNTFLLAFQKIFIINLYSLLKQKNFSAIFYFYKIILNSIKNPYLIKSLIDSIRDKTNWNQLKI